MSSYAIAISYATADPNDKQIIDCCNITSSYEDSIKTGFLSKILSGNTIDPKDCSDIELLYSREIHYYNQKGDKKILQQVPIGVYYKKIDSKRRVFCLCCNNEYTVNKYEQHCAEIVYREYLLKQIQNGIIIDSLSSIKKEPQSSQQRDGIYILDRIPCKEGSYILVLTSKTANQLVKMFKKYIESFYVMVLFPGDKFEHALVEAYPEVVYQPVDDNDNIVKVTTTSNISSINIDNIKLVVNLVNSLKTEDCRYFYEHKKANFENILNCGCTECNILIRKAASKSP